MVIEYVLAVGMGLFYMYIFFKMTIAALFDPDFWSTSQYYNEADGERLFNSAMFLEQDD